MNLSLDDLKESNEFLKLLSQNLNSAVFIVDSDVRIQNFNQTTLNLFLQTPKNILNQYCGNSIGCIHPFEEKTDCGKTSYCGHCLLRRGILKALNEGETTLNQKLERDFVLGGKKIHKYLYFSVKQVVLKFQKLALLIVDDLSELEEQKQEMARKNRMMEKDLELAAKIQQSLIPQEIPQVSGACWTCLYQPMQQLGGDFYDFIEAGGPDKTGIFISDVSGHGVSAALITGMVKTLIDNAGRKRKQPEEFLAYLNEKLQGKTSEHFLTAFYGVYHSSEKTLTYARAGHPYPLLIRGNKVVPLESEGMVLGVFSGLEFSRQTLTLQRGDRILFYTDGLSEASDAQGRLFGSILHSTLQDLKQIPFKDFLSNLYERWKNFQTREEIEDDLCLIAMEVTEEFL